MSQPVSPQYPSYPAGYGYAAPASAPPWSGPPGPVVAARTNVMAIVALVTAIVVGAIPIIAVVCAVVSLRQIRRTGEQGRWMAITGLVLGLIGCAGWVLFWVLIAVNGGEFHYSYST